MGIVRGDWSFNNGLKFNGTSHYADMGNILNFEYTDALSISSIFTVQDFTVLQPGTNRWIFWKGLNGFPAYGYFIDSTQISFVFSHSPTQALIFRHLFSPVINTVYHITFTKTASQTAKFYINGVQNTADIVSVGTMATTLNTDSFLLCEAKDGAGLMQAYFKATLYDLKIFNRDLTSIEALALYNNSNCLIPASCIGNNILDLRFEEKQGTSVKDSSTNAFSCITNHTAPQTTLGAGNYWTSKYGNPILTL